MKILYIAGFGRSGSTLLDNILNQVPGVLSVGELRYLWDRGIIEDSLCGCGRPFSKCTFWASIVGRAYGSIGSTDVQHVVKLRERVHVRHGLLNAIPGGEHILAERVAPYAAHVARVYRAIQQETDCEVIVDSSKFPSHGYALDQILDIELYVLHLIRDARAVSFSWMRKKEYEINGGQIIKRQHPLRSAWLWNSWNAVVEARWSRQLSSRYTRIRYEDFVSHPEFTIRHVLKFLDRPVKPLSPLFTADNMVKMGENHAVSGNPSRFKQGAIKLRLDQEWKRDMKLRDKVLVTTLSWPLLKHHDYI